MSWLRQAKWFCAASKRQPALSAIVVVLRSVFRHEQHWSALSERDVEVLCQIALADQSSIMPLKAIEIVLKVRHANTYNTWHSFSSITFFHEDTWVLNFALSYAH